MAAAESRVNGQRRPAAARRRLGVNARPFPFCLVAHYRGSGGLVAPRRCRVYYARRDMSATLYYTLLRVLLFFAVAVVLALFGVHGITLLAVALVISAVLSLLFLSRLRDRMSASLTRRVDRFHQRLDEGTRAEDID
jgi:hypothetical protein